MVAIFASTTTWLSDEFLSRVPISVLSQAIENLNSISGVNCKQIKGEVKVSGKWQQLVTAYSLLEHCLETNLPSQEEDNKSDIIEPVDNGTDHSDGAGGLTDGEAVTVKQEKDADSDGEKKFKDISPKKPHRKRPVVNYFDGENFKDASPKKTHRKKLKTVVNYVDEDTQDLDYLPEVEVKEEEEDLKPKPKKKKKGGGFPCDQCNYIGKVEKQLQSHVLRKHQRKFKCSECGKRYGYKADLQRHKSEVHSKNREQYFCNICNKYLKTKAYIDDHMQLHNDNYVYHCKICEKSFSTRLIFGKHIKIQHPKMQSVLKELDKTVPIAAAEAEEKKVKSKVGTSAEDKGDQEEDQKPDFNSETDPDLAMLNLMSVDDSDKVLHETDTIRVSFKRGRNRGRPRIKSHYEERTEFRCHLCDYVGKKECHLEYHIKRNHSQKLICDICNKQFGYNWDLKRHREQVHAEASFFCHICSKAYKVKKSFEEHLRSHEDGYIKSRYPCTECEKSFSAKQVLDNHMKYKHLGVKQKEKQRYLCQTCGQEFYHKYSYQSHMNKHQGLMPYNCDICGKAFASEHSVREHQIVHKNIRNYCCKVCAKTFKTSSALKAHEAIHNNSKDFICGVCGKGFIQKQSLLRHERIHSGYKPYKCKLCERPFTDSATVRKHMILVHKKDPHDWQGDVISDLKRPREYWPEDWSVDGIKAKKDAMENMRTQHSSLQSRKISLDSEMDYSEEIAPVQNTQSNMHDDQDIPRHIPVPDQQSSMQSGPLSLVHSPDMHLHQLPNAQLPMTTVPSNLEPLTPVEMTSNHITPHSSAVEMAAASILNLSAHLPPMPQQMPLNAVQQMDNQMPSILNLSTMHNMNYTHNQHGST